MDETKVQLGSKVKDVITGFEGIATARAEYLHGMPRCLVEAPSRDGKFQEAWLEESRLETVAETSAS